MFKLPPNVYSIEKRLVKGDPLEPQSDDIIILLGRLPVGDSVPEDWRVLTGNMADSLVATTVMRYEVEDLF